MIDPNELRQIERAAVAMLQSLTHAGGAAITAQLQPHDGDYARVFLGDAAARARAGYAELWTQPPTSLGKLTQTGVHAFAAPAAAFRTENDASGKFPGGYRTIADQLAPDQIWLCFELIARGERRGMSYDGLVWLDGRWAWFPKPWRHLAPRAGT